MSAEPITAPTGPARSTGRCDHKALRINLKPTDPPWCPECGEDLDATLVVALAPATKRRGHRRPRMRPPPAPDKRVSQFIREALWFGVQRERVERAAHMDCSPTAAAIARVELYTIGSDGRRIKGEYRGKIRGAYLGPGNRGTKGCVTGSAYEQPDPVHVDPGLQARYDALRFDERATVDAIIEDGAGDQTVVRWFGPVSYALSLSQRVAFRLIDVVTLGKWSGKLAAQDSAPALAASEKQGVERIAAASSAWWAVP